MKKIRRMNTLLIILLSLAAFVVFVMLFIRLNPVFGGKHSEESIARFQEFPNYKNGVFYNLEDTPVMVDRSEMPSNILKMIKGVKDGKPEIVETLKFNRDEFMKDDASAKYAWLGHSTVLMRVGGINIITDPVFSGHASPFSFTNKSFNYSNNYNVEDLPFIDVVLISHDHYDHLDMKSIKKLGKTDAMFIVPLGVESHLMRWGIKKEKINSAAWWDELEHKGINFISAPARHFSGRAFKRNNTLWCSWVIKSNSNNIYFGADSGYGSHFKEIGERLGPFDIGFMECGQYNKAWAHIHSMPEESVQSSIDVKAKKMMTIHWGKFQLALHPWFEPARKAKMAATEKGVDLLNADIGKIYSL